MDCKEIDFIEISKKRVTTRKFSQKKVEKEKIDKILEAGRFSPTAVNAQPQRILVIDEEDVMAKVKEFCTFGYSKEYVELAKECYDGKGEHNIYYYGSPLIFLICYDKESCWKHPETGESSGIVDATIVSTHMMLEAASINLGTVWISHFDKDKARKLLCIPDNWEISNMLYVGYPAEEINQQRKGKANRNDISVTARYNNVDNPYE